MPEYGHSAVVHRKRKIKRSVAGRVTHGDGEERAGQKNEARGKAGRLAFVVESVMTVPLLLLDAAPSAFRRFLGLCAEEGVGGIADEGEAEPGY